MRANNPCPGIALKPKIIAHTKRCPTDTEMYPAPKPHISPAVKIPPEQFPDPWFFDSEKLINELDRIRESVLRIPTNGDKHALHFGINNAISSIWNLREQLRYLLALHRDGQRAFAKRVDDHPAKLKAVSKRLLRK
jgi:hypothetical protein